MARQPPPTTAALDSLQVIGQFEYVPHNYAVFADMDRDGANEIVFGKPSPTSESVLRVLEYAEYGQFVRAFDGTYVVPFTAGDADQDGKSEIVGLGPQGRLQVFEAIDAHSYPSTLAWESPPISNQEGFAAIADTDGDGRLEIVYLFYAGVIRIIIFECEGDNTYVQKYLSPRNLAPAKPPDPSLQAIYSPWAGDELVLDLDQDGRPEIVDGGQGKLQIYKSTADDVWERIYTDSTGLLGSRILTGGQDTDGDGKRELFLGGEDWTDESAIVRKVVIYQPNGHGSFTRVATLSANDGVSGVQWGALARTDYSGKIRFVWALHRHMRIFAATGAGEWTLETIIPDPFEGYHHAVFAYDLNRNGRDEIYWLTDARTVPSLILEQPTLPTDLSGTPGHPFVTTLRVAPSPCRNNAAVFLDPVVASRAAGWSIFDASGRLVLQDRSNPRAGVWPFPARTLAPGLYFVRATDALGRPLANGRATVLR